MRNTRNNATDPPDEVPLQESTRAKQGGKSINFHSSDVRVAKQEEYNQTITSLPPEELIRECIRLKTENAMLMYFVSEKGLLREFTESRGVK
ncbi:MAG: hypothetical protein A2W93_14285 [Bacteroidetes bacterium GWF2_43_63]|nr:MAG: hypothetical protein A2W94_00855 [Bacteroidetes bacterium GWE2_42_42]OFY52509.1 MAG: hypothetical protein A2W93_14285 [Bacteroidetes bacterium GWF2_43_63]HBG71416.1 hypothetical protein [Bacteroidales bacterium]HCB60832.1 hypothetical protein [Bacteroidales bacterium]HCY23443.1 hypothetical protein [Bacteroidales bacterium]